MLCFLVLFAGALFLFVRSAKATAGEALVRFGGELLAWQDARVRSPRTLALNGLELHLTTLSTDLDVHDALAHFRASCRERGGLARPASAADAGERLPELDGVFSWESAREGVVACVETGHPLSLSEVVDRLNRFRQTGDLSAVGELRYVLARRSSSVTTLLALWSEGPLPLAAAFPKDGDAPGHDPLGVPRPPESRRVLGAVETGAPYSVHVYRLPRTDEARAAAWYETALRGAGWAAVRDGSGFRGERGGRTVLVRISTPKTGGSVASVAELSGGREITN